MNRVPIHWRSRDNDESHQHLWVTKPRKSGCGKFQVHPEVDKLIVQGYPDNQTIIGTGIWHIFAKWFVHYRSLNCDFLNPCEFKLKVAPMFRFWSNSIAFLSFIEGMVPWNRTTQVPSHSSVYFTSITLVMNNREQDQNNTRFEKLQFDESHQHELQIHLIVWWRTQSECCDSAIWKQ
jgi:hypothetical protein